MDEEEKKPATRFHPIWFVSAGSFAVAFILCIISFAVFRNSVSGPYFILLIVTGLLFALAFVAAIIAKAKKNRFSLPFIIASPVGIGWLLTPLLALMALGWALSGNNRAPSSSLLESVKIEHFLASCGKNHSFGLAEKPNPVIPIKDYDGSVIQAMKDAEYSESGEDGKPYSNQIAFTYHKGDAAFSLSADYQLAILTNHDSGSFWSSPTYVSRQYYLQEEQGKAIYDAAKASLEEQIDAYAAASSHAMDDFDVAYFIAQEESAPFISFFVYPEEGEAILRGDDEKALLAKMKEIEFTETAARVHSEMTFFSFVYNPPNASHPADYLSYFRMNREKDLAEIYFPYEDSCGKHYSLYKTFSLALEDGQALYDLALSIAQAA